MGLELLTKLNSAPMFLVAGVVILFVAGLCVVYLVKSYRAGVALGMDKTKLRRAMTSSATFTLLPSISILLGVIALAGSLGIPLPWIRLSVVGALHYEASVADIAARNAGLPGGLGSGELTPTVFVTIALLMAVGIVWGLFYSLFGLKAYLGKVHSRKKAEKPAVQADAPKKQNLGDVMFVAMFVGLVSAYIGSYIGKGAVGQGWLSLAVAVLSGLVMAALGLVSRRMKWAWMDNFSMALSMLAGMAGAIVLGTML